MLWLQALELSDLDVVHQDRRDWCCVGDWMGVCLLDLAVFTYLYG